MIIYKLIEEEKKKGKLIVIASHSNLNDIKFDEIIIMSEPGKRKCPGALAGYGISPRSVKRRDRISET